MAAECGGNGIIVVGKRMRFESQFGGTPSIDGRGREGSEYVSIDRLNRGLRPV
jgi:hypothetical protein